MSRISQFLTGVKVVDLSRHLPGPLASQMMLDMGAEVLKVEPPGGEEMRFIGTLGRHGRSAYFDAVNAGKDGIKLDLKSEQGRHTLLEILADADVMIESFRPGVLAKLGLSIETLRQTFPRLIICSLNGYGEHSPLQQEVGHDINYLAMNGVLAGTGTQDEAVAPWPPLADCSASLFGLSTLLAALYERERSGKGCHVEVALADSVMPLMVFPLADVSVTGKGMPRAVDLLNGGAARYRTYKTKDGHSVAMGGVELKFWNNFCHGADHPEWLQRINDPLPQTEMQALLAEYFGGLTLQECNDRFANVDCCFNQVLELKDAVNTEHMQMRKLVVKQDGDYQALIPAYVDGQPAEPRKPFSEQLNSEQLASEQLT